MVWFLLEFLYILPACLRICKKILILTFQYGPYSIFFVFVLILDFFDSVVWERILHSISSIWTIVTNSIHFVGNSWWSEITTMTPLMRGVILQIFVISMIVILIHVFRKTKFWIAFSLLFEGMYEFFEEILGKAQRKTFKMYVVTLFFVILISNLLSYTIDLVRVVFMDIEALPRYIVIPTTDFNFNLALAAVSIIIMLYIQFRRAWVIKFFLEYIPITGKWILDIERGNMKAFIYYPAKVVVKIFDIGISLFVWVLDIIGIWAKAISLTARLYGNMLAWWILLWLLIAGVNSAFHGIFQNWFPVLWPLILYAQWLLVASIQAFVFPLLVAIFIKIAQEGD